MSENTNGTFDPPPVAPEMGNGGDEYVFRFRLDPSAGDDRGPDDPLLELVRGQIADLLRVVVLTYHGRRVMVDGFHFLKEPDTIHMLFPPKEG